MEWDLFYGWIENGDVFGKLVVFIRCNVFEKVKCIFEVYFKIFEFGK